MILDILEFEVENKHENLGKTVLQMWPQICEIVASFSKVKKSIKKKKKNTKATQSLADSGDKASFSS